MSTQESTTLREFNLNEESAQAIESFMSSNELYTCAAIGKYLGKSRERVRQIFANREDLDFKTIKSRIIKNKFNDKGDNLNWKLITFVNTKYPYYVSDCGQVSRMLTYKKHGVEVNKLKLLTPSSSKSKYLRVNLTLNNKGETENKTFYVQTIVASEFLAAPDPSRKLRGVTFKDKNVQNCRVDNLRWSYKKED